MQKSSIMYGLLFGLLLLVPMGAECGEGAPGKQDTVRLQWLGNDASGSMQGVTWGVPWKQGALKKGRHMLLLDDENFGLPLQTWPLAYWPDGTVKWLGCATTAWAGQEGMLKMVPGEEPEPMLAVEKPEWEVRESDKEIVVLNGGITCRIPKSGQFILKEMKIGDVAVACNGFLKCSLEKEAMRDGYETRRKEDFVSEVRKATVERKGSVAMVVKIEGVHRSVQGDREWLPFVVRLYFYSGVSSLRMVHTVIFDGDQQEDFIKGLGLECSVPMREQVYNRHIRFSGEGDGLWAEPVQPMVGRGGRFVRNAQGRDVYPGQLEGKRVAEKQYIDERDRELLDHWAVWNDFRMSQPNAGGFTIEKRTNDRSSWIAAGAGNRAGGLVFAGDLTGGLAIGMKDFWQSCPSSLEVLGAASDTATMNAWLWSPDAPAMDMRHYDTLSWGHGLEAAYEDVQPGFSTPYGIARTSELTLFPSSYGVPDRQQIVNESRIANHRALLVCAPEYLHDAGVFGIWSLPDTSTPFRKAVEKNLSVLLDYYKKSVDQREWYGFWDYGDVMHSYDRTRHVWRYDLGGMAWDNTELGTDAWLWYSFLRTGREDVFRMAEAMTRHTSEVDCYHTGRFAGLGSRHNVRHWGGGAKELRISQAFFRRFYYYLTCDERTGDIMHEVADADLTLEKLDPMRLARPITEAEKKYPARIRGGPDWLAAVGNWMTEWERTGNTKYRDKIYTGMDCIAGMPYGFLTGPENLFGYDPETGRLYPLTDDPFGTYNLTTIQGGAEVVFDLNGFIDHKGWDKAWLQYCRLHDAPEEVVRQDMKTGREGKDGSYAERGRLAAYVYWRTGNKAFIEPAVKGLVGRWGLPNLETRKIDGPDVLKPVDEIPFVSTNWAAQFSLTAIEVLEMCGDALPEEVPEPERERPAWMR